MSSVLHRRLALLSLALVCLAAGVIAAPATARAADYVPGEVLVGYTASAPTAAVADAERQLGARSAPGLAPDPSTRLLRLPRGESVDAAIRRLRHRPGVAFAVPNFLAHADGIGWFPNDRGRAHVHAGWERMQWNFLPGAGVDAPWAWANLIRDHRPGGRGVIVAVLDTGVAYRNWRNFRVAPDFARTRFVAPYDFVAHNRYPLDRQGHGTFVTGTIAESTNNHIGLTGIAYGASIMPVRVLASDGTGDAATIARGIRYAVRHHARVINLSLEFTPDVTAGDIPDILRAIGFANRRGVVVVAASGNEGQATVAYPARARPVISVGATTRDRCLAEYSNGGPDLALVAPGGGDDTPVLDDPDCHFGRQLPPIYQMTFANPAEPARFGFPSTIYGTSMSTPHVSAGAALVIASRVLGLHPSPTQVRQQLEATAQPLGVGRPNPDYGWGLLDAGAATAQAQPLPPPTPPS